MVKTEFALTQQNTPDPADGTPRRFHVELLIVHPTFDPKDISAALGLEGHVTHRVGDRRKTPKGTVLAGHYPDTRWRHCVEYSAPDQFFAAEVSSFVDKLGSHKVFLADLKATGGKASVIIQFLGDGYYADKLPHATLAKVVELELDLAIECFIDPQP
jgi:hypothetical protein